MTPFFEVGSIVWVEVLDPAGKNRKDRPVLLLRASGSGAGILYDAVGITSSFTRPLQPDEVALPYSANPQSPAKTGLTLPSVAKLNWRLNLAHDAIRQKSGYISATLLLEICTRLGI